MSANDEQDYALSPGQNSEVPKPKLGSKIGSTREGGRGGSEDVAGGQEVIPNPPFKFFGAADGSNTDTFHQPDVKQPSKPTLGDY